MLGSCAAVLPHCATPLGPGSSMALRFLESIADQVQALSSCGRCCESQWVGQLRFVHYEVRHSLNLSIRKVTASEQVSLTRCMKIVFVSWLLKEAKVTSYPRCASSARIPATSGFRNALEAFGFARTALAKAEVLHTIRTSRYALPMLACKQYLGHFWRIRGSASLYPNAWT